MSYLTSYGGSSAPVALVVGRQSASVLAEAFGNETVLYQRRGHKVLHLNEAASRAWEMCDGTRTVADLAKGLCESFGFAPDEALAAMNPLVAELVAGEFVERAELDRLIARYGRPYASPTVEWVWARRYEMLGVGVIIRTNDRRAADTLCRTLSIFESDSPAAPSDLVFSVVRFIDSDGDVVYDAIRETPSEGAVKMLVDKDTFDTAVMETIVRINSSVIHGSRLYGIHAAGLTAGDRTLVLPAKRNAGKSTLAAAMSRLGFGYLSDENVALNWTDQPVVVPYPKPLWLSGWTRDELEIDPSAVLWDPPEYKDAIVDAQLLGASLPPAGRCVTDVLCLEQRDGDGPTIESMTPAAGAALLIENTFDRDLDPERVFRYAQVVARSCAFWRLEYSDPVRAAHFLADHFRLNG